MPNPNHENLLTLIIITPDAPAQEILCDAIRLTIPENLRGRGDGLYGIHPGHAAAFLALKSGDFIAALGEKTVLHSVVGEGFVRIDRNRVTVTTESVCAAAAE